jgi:hypothetical protein
MGSNPVLLIGTRDGVVDLEGVGSLAGRRAGPFTTGSAGGDRVLGLVDGTSVVRRDGSDWREVARLAERGTCLAASDGTLFVGTVGAHVDVVDAETARLERSDAFESAPTRGEWHTPWGGPADTRSITVTADGTVLANVHVGGILRSTDDGASWKPTIDLHSDVHQVLAHPRVPGVALAAAAVGLCRSDDDGITWEVVDEGLHATYLRAVAIAGDTVLVSASTGPGGSRSAIYRRPLDAGADAPFERCRDGLPDWLAGNIDTFCLVGDPDGDLVAFGDHEGGVFVSTDRGRTWEAAGSGLGPVVALTLAKS